MNEQRLEQAADWVDRINDLNDHDREELSLWLKCTENKNAFEKIANVFGDPAVKQALHIYTKQYSLPTPIITPNAKRSRTFPMLALAASFSAIAFAVYWLAISQQTFTPTPIAKTAVKSSLPQLLEAHLGKRVSQLLDDGSYLHLNADSELTAHLLPHSRQIELKKGQVFFDVAKDKTRPFIINSGQASIKVLGTSFDVERNKDEVVVTVYEGKVEVSALDKVILTPSQQAVIKNGHITVDYSQQLAQLPAWRMGWIDAEKEPLTSVIKQLQRYSPTVIKVDNTLNNTLISGRFNLETPQQSLMLIASTYNWKVDKKNNVLHLTLP
ncbi:FecR family protein [Pseudoalteromonas sp. NZS100]|uniref:FecR family protein n=1 Tax=Pseudoalteromonas sp. NZS100 TaxID=2792046 RepID=UPI0018CD7095|nr:FecR domain-containing protein [Pseudoalteromonas sp. NZS100]MBH0070155.1 FecR domain-containing protein [Pseudoalteromonas sp. NZS100]